MKSTRVILHCDLNCFYASVEIKLHPELKGKAVAVCGSVEDRHGIVLAKSDPAKKAGVKTAEAVWQAKQKCPELIVVSPHYEEYIKYSQLARKIYEDYTDLIEPFGIDECWLDVTGSTQLFGSGEEIAHKIRTRIKQELGITISVGVSFNKVFAKLGSDMKKPDAVTVIPFESFREKIWNLPASDMIWIGGSTAAKLERFGILTIGDLARSDPEFIIRSFGKCGVDIWRNANGLNDTPVMQMSYSAPIKSVGHGTTCLVDLTEEEQVWRVFYELSQDVARRLRKHGLTARGVQITVRDKDLGIRQYQRPLPITTQCFGELAATGMRLFTENYDWAKPIRSLTIRAINLIDASTPVQLGLDYSYEQHEKRDKIEVAMEKVRKRYGQHAVNMCCLNLDLKMTEAPSAVHGIPTMYR